MAASINNNRKSPRQLETYSEPIQTSKMRLFANMVDFIQTFTIFEKHSVLGVSQGYKCASDKTKQKLGALLFISQKIRTANSVDFFKF